MFINYIYCVNCRAHWQLIVLCPTNNLVVWFCSMRKRPDVHIKTAINKLSNIFEVVQHLFYIETYIVTFYICKWYWCSNAVHLRHYRRLMTAKFLKLHPSGLKLRLVPVQTMFANENVLKLFNTNIQLFFSFHVESRSTRRL